MIKVRINEGELKSIAKSFKKLITRNHKKAMLKAAATGLNRIQKRTSMSLDINEQPFRPLSEGYQAYRFKRRNQMGKKSTLIFSGRMRKSMQFSTRGQDGIIYFDSRREAEKAAMNSKIRPFFGLNRGDERAVRQAYFEGLRL
jgi:hypothetical protein